MISNETSQAIIEVPETTQVEVVVPEVAVAASKVPWSDDEDVQLCKSWLNVSINATTGTDQKSDGFWWAVHADYHRNKDKGLVNRSQAALTIRWGVFNHLVSKFYGCYKQVQSLNASGTNDLSKVQYSVNFNIHRIIILVV